MLVEQLRDRVASLRLSGMLKALEEQLDNPKYLDLSFEERLSMLIDRENIYRENKRLQNRLKQARLKSSATIEDIDFQTSRGLNKKQILSLASCAWIMKKQNLIITGPTGSGKSYLSIALAQKACREGLTALYFRVPMLFEDIALAKLDNKYKRFLERIGKINLLILDDWGLFSLSEEQRREFLEIAEKRYSTGSMIVVSQTPIDRWFKLIGEPTIADAILDRIIHNSQRLALSGESMRKKLAEKSSQTVA